MKILQFLTTEDGERLLRLALKTKSHFSAITPAFTTQFGGVTPGADPKGVDRGRMETPWAKAL